MIAYRPIHRETIMYRPAEHDEITGILNYLDQQLDAIRASAYGLTEEQARETPTRSSLSIAGLVKHIVYGLRGAVSRLGDPPAQLDADAYTAYANSFVLGEGETVTALLAEFDRVRPEFLAAVEATDPDGVSVEPPSPWHGVFAETQTRTRFYLVHIIEELARHAGHADIIREQLDGIAIPALVLTLEGASANDFFQPYSPDPGTIGA